jgi:hypothetical protein
VEGSLDAPALTGRSSFTEVIQEGVLRDQLRALNPGPDGEPWLDNARLSEAVAAITRLSPHKLMEANQKATELLVKGLNVEGLPGWDGGCGQTIRYIDSDTPARNRFTVVNQYRVDCPPGHNSARAFIVPDLVLLVNGLPPEVVECKSLSVLEPLAEAVDHPGHPAVSAAAPHCQALCPGPADRHGGGPGRPGDPHRQVRPRQAAVPLGSLRPARRAQLLLGARVLAVGQQVLWLRADPAHRAGGGGGLPGR